MRLAVFFFLFFSAVSGPRLQAEESGVQNPAPQTNDTGEITMNIPTRAIISGVLFIPIMAAGYWLSHKGTPYNPFISAVHKLSAVANLFLLNFTVFQLGRVVPLDGGDITATVIMDICFVAAVATGALVSGERQMPAAVEWAHRIVPWAAVAASGVLLFLMNKAAVYAK